VNLRSLEALCAVSEAKSLTAAARKLRISTATISERLQTLDRDLNARLVIRSGRTMVLTPAGEAVVHVAEKILQQVRGLKQVAHSEKVGGKLRIGAIASTLTSLFPSALKKIADEFPNIDLLVVPGTSASLYAQMEDKSIDCAVMVETPFRMSKKFEWSVIRTERLVLVSHQGDLRSNVKATIEQNRFIRIDRDDWTGQIVSRYLRDTGITTRDLFELNALETILNLVAQKLGVAILPDWGISKSGQKRIQVVPLPEAGYFRTIGLVSAGVSSNAALVQAVLGVFQDLARRSRLRN
jgi:DNA-binding transcriptional LysR family regulator